MKPQQTEARRRLKAFYDDLKAVCEKHSGTIDVAPHNKDVVRLRVEGMPVRLHLDPYSTTIAWWAWDDIEERPITRLERFE